MKLMEYSLPDPVLLAIQWTTRLVPHVAVRVAKVGRWPRCGCSAKVTVVVERDEVLKSLVMTQWHRVWAEVNSRSNNSHETFYFLITGKCLLIKMLNKRPRILLSWQSHRCFISHGASGVNYGVLQMLSWACKYKLSLTTKTLFLTKLCIQIEFNYWKIGRINQDEGPFSSKNFQV